MQAFRDAHPAVEFDLRAFQKDINPDVSVQIGPFSVKFHMLPLDQVGSHPLSEPSTPLAHPRSCHKVIQEELALGQVEAVPPNYFETIA